LINLLTHLLFEASYQRVKTEPAWTTPLFWRPTAQSSYYGKVQL